MCQVLKLESRCRCDLTLTSWTWTYGDSISKVLRQCNAQDFCTTPAYLLALFLAFINSSFQTSRAKTSTIGSMRSRGFVT